VRAPDGSGADGAAAPPPAPKAVAASTVREVVREVVRTHLALPLTTADAAASTPRTLHDPRVRIVRRAPCGVAEYRALYRMVGEAHRWRDRLAWSDAQLGEWLARPDVAVWVLEHDGQPGGYYELARRADGADVEIVYFGLVAALHGRGLGRALLEHAIGEAARMGAGRVVLNTCTLDGPAALPNYLARGFRRVREERYEERYTVTPD
jgi:GNAT superfamily N-acetyltransferase